MTTPRETLVIKPVPRRFSSCSRRTAHEAGVHVKGDAIRSKRQMGDHGVTDEWCGSRPPCGSQRMRFIGTISALALVANLAPNAKPASITAAVEHVLADTDITPSVSRLRAELDSYDTMAIIEAALTSEPMPT